MVILKKLVVVVEQAYVQTKAREAKALAMGRTVPPMDIAFDTAWNHIAVDIMCRYECEERQVFSGLPKTKDEEDALGGSLGDIKLKPQKGRVLAYAKECVLLVCNVNIGFGEACIKDFNVVVNDQPYDIIEITQSDPDHDPGWIKLEVEGITFNSTHTVHVSYGRRRIEPANRLASSEALASQMDPFEELQCENLTECLYMKSATCKTSQIIEVELSEPLNLGKACKDDFVVTFAGERRIPNEIVQSSLDAIPGMLTFHFTMKATPGDRVEFTYTLDTDSSFEVQLASRGGIMQSQPGLKIMIPMLAGKPSIWKEFYRSYVETTEQPTPRFVTARGTSGHDAVSYMELLNTNREKDRLKREAIHRREAKLARRAAGQKAEEEEEEKPWLEPCKEHHTESCPICWDMNAILGVDDNDDEGNENENAADAEREIGVPFQGGGMKSTEFSCKEVLCLLPKGVPRYTGNDGRAYFITILAALLSMQETIYSRAILPVLKKEPGPRIELTDIKDFMPLETHDAEGRTQKTGVAAGIHDDTFQLAYNNGEKMSWADAVVRHDEFGDDHCAEPFIEDTLKPLEEKGFKICTLGMEHYMKKQGWGGQMELLGAAVLMPGDDRMPQYIWDFDSVEGHSTLHIKVPGTLLMDIELKIEDQMFVILDTGADCKPTEIYCGWRMPLDRGIDAGCNPKAFWVKGQKEGILGWKFKTAMPTVLKQIKEMFPDEVGWQFPAEMDVDQRERGDGSESD